ncbi:MAG TPA: hypothetical protein VEB60_01290 [Candidatus Paceibacterota bacterium]|nr:hypothetical protein [Candidatus Paceibacterota bacterium]
MNKKARLILLVAATLIIAGILAAAFSGSPAAEPPATSGKALLRAFSIPELGIKLEIPSAIEEPTYRIAAVRAVGPVAHVSTRSLSEANPECSLGVLYKLPIDANQKTRWTKQELEAATAWHDDRPPQAKKLGNFYLVFEPSQTVCSADAQTEAGLRSEFWKSLQSAEVL